MYIYIYIYLKKNPMRNIRKDKNRRRLKKE